MSEKDRAFAEAIQLIERKIQEEVNHPRFGANGGTEYSKALCFKYWQLIQDIKALARGETEVGL